MDIAYWYNVCCSQLGPRSTSEKPVLAEEMKIGIPDPMSAIRPALNPLMEDRRGVSANEGRKESGRTPLWCLAFVDTI